MENEQIPQVNFDMENNANTEELDFNFTPPFERRAAGPIRTLRTRVPRRVALVTLPNYLRPQSPYENYMRPATAPEHDASLS